MSLAENFTSKIKFPKDFLSAAIAVESFCNCLLSSFFNSLQSNKYLMKNDGGWIRTADIWGLKATTVTAVPQQLLNHNLSLDTQSFQRVVVVAQLLLTPEVHGSYPSNLVIS